MPAPNQRLGEYVLLDRIGSGAFGEVWRARHHTWDQTVAIKIPTEPQYVRNLQREGNAVHGLSHPNIVKAIAFDPYADPAYFVMEYIPGTSLRSLIQRGPMRPEQVVEIMKQVLAALHHAHQHGLVHRDIKPENILIHKAAERKGFASGTVKLTDFGLGKVATQIQNSIVFSQDRSEAEQLIGSQQYMSPEQLAAGEVDGRADLYSCGVVLFEMLTGHRPAGVEVPSDLNAAVPQAVDEVFRRAFARLERRFRSAEEFFRALEQAMTPPLPVNVRSWNRRWRWITAGGMVAALVACSTWLWIKNLKEPIRPVMASDRKAYPAQAPPRQKQLSPDTHTAPNPPSSVPARPQASPGARNAFPAKPIPAIPAVAPTPLAKNISGTRQADVPQELPSTPPNSLDKVPMAHSDDAFLTRPAAVKYQREIEAAEHEFERKLQLLRLDYEAKTGSTCKIYITSLKAAQSDETKKGKFEVAIAIKEAIAKLEADAQSVWPQQIFPLEEDAHQAVIPKKENARSVEIVVGANRTNHNPVDTGFVLAKGQLFTLEPNANDKWTGGGTKAGQLCDYRGCQDKDGWMALMWKVAMGKGTGSRPSAPVTAGQVLSAPEAGKLFLYCSDNDPRDNSGSIRVTVSTK